MGLEEACFLLNIEILIIFYSEQISICFSRLLLLIITNDCLIYKEIIPLELP